MKAIWNEQILAESDDTIIVENNHYFPAASLRSDFFLPSNTRTHCAWKGEAHYYSIAVDGKQNTDAAWFYPDPKDAAMAIKGRVAFWKGVKVTP